MKIITYFILFYFLIVVAHDGVLAEEKCCNRDILIAPIKMPEGQQWDYSAWITGSFWKGIKEQGKLGDCPLDCAVSDSPRGDFTPGNVEYVFRGDLQVNPTGYEDPIWEESSEPGVQILAGGGSHIGDWILHMELLDAVRGTQLKEGEFKWSGTIGDIIVQRKWVDGPGVYVPYFGGYHYPLTEWAKTFLPEPLDDFLYDYERTPQKCTVEPEEEEVEADEEIAIHVKDIQDHKGRPPQPWQWILVQVEKGKIKNEDFHKKGDFYIFEAGDGNIELKYQAPEECKKDTEKITIHNSCNIFDDPNRTVPWDEIAEKEFEIVCNQWEGSLESIFTMSAGEGESLITALVPGSKYQAFASWKLDVVFKFERGNERVMIYELKSAKFRYLDELKMDIKWEREGRRMHMDGSGEAKVSGRALSPSECDLELIIDKKKKTYKIEGMLRVEDIPGEGETQFQVDIGPVKGGEKDTDEGMEEHSEDILIEGKYSEDVPKTLEGSLDEIKETPPDFQEFLKGMAGDISGEIRWKLKKKEVNKN
jgi:hypothetical protein